MFDAAVVEDVGHSYVAIQANVPVGSAESDLHVAEAPALLIRHEIDRIIEINRIIIKAIEKAPDVEYAAHTEEICDLVGMAEGEISGMETAKAATRHADLADITFIPYIRYELVFQEFVVLNVVRDPVFGIEMLRVPGVGVDRVHTVNLVFPRFDQPPDGFDQAHVLGLVIPAERRGEEQDRVAPTAENKHLHVLVEMMRVVFNVLLFQTKTVYS